MTRPCTTGTFTTWDDTSLFYRTWPPAAASTRALILIHRGHEHSGRLQEQVDRLDLPDLWMFSWDQRGHGQSPGARGHAPSYAALVRDLDCFARHVCATHGLQLADLAILANSVGAVTAATWVHDYAPGIRALVLAAPALRIRLYVPLAIPLLRLWLRLNPAAVVSSYVKAKMLTHDPEQSAAYEADALITRDISVEILLGLHDTATRVIADASAIQVPTLVLSAGADWVVQNGAQRRFYRRLGASVKRMDAYPGFFHALLFEQGRAAPLAVSRAFLCDCFAQPVARADLLAADRGGPTRTEYDLLRQPAGWPRQWLFSAMRWGMQTIGRLSQGIRIGLETGFDSGTALDYVYENQARGTGRIGRWLDRLYLDAVGWRGIRARREHLQELLRQALREQAARHGQVEVLDVATGCGRYVLDVIEQLPELTIHARLRDWTPANLARGAALAQARGLAGVTFEPGDAFDDAGLRAIEPRPRVVIVSGLYELFADNDGVRRSLAGIAAALQPGGVLLYTCQPWHPQLEFIARTLVNREGQPWIMRRRSQAEMDALVAAAGLVKEAMRIDDWGIFTVALARKPDQT